MTTKAKQLVVISGKGGTGKTTIVAALAALAAGTVIIADCDVDAPDLHLVLNPMSPELRKESFRAGKEAGIAAEKCNGCGLCAQYCRFGAIHALRPARSLDSTGPVDLVHLLASTDAADAADTAFLPTAPPAQVKYAVDPLACEGCGLCARVCPQKAVEMFEPERGAWFISDTPYGPLVHAQLSIGGENSGRLVTIVRNEANRLAAEEGQALILIDGPPGVGCPVIASVTGT
ncbi:MAG: 4Fe-4S binding protein, partial [Thermoleophilia bacterium]|nr:4Fe-4S binding protein [Thermoleophilia bacterium]